MWGGTPDRNLVSGMKGLPTSWDIKSKKNIKWVAELGSQAYGNPVVANGVVLVGTNNESMKDPAVKGDKGILMAFRESDGQFLWQAVHDKLSSGRANDWPFQGVCSSPLIENGVAYYVSNRGEVMALDLDGFRDATRRLVARQAPPASVLWGIEDTAIFGADLPEAASPLALPRLVSALVETAICHRDSERYALLYTLIWRVLHGERRLLEIASDPLVHRL